MIVTNKVVCLVVSFVTCIMVQSLFMREDKPFTYRDCCLTHKIATEIAVVGILVYLPLT